MAGDLGIDGLELPLHHVGHLIDRFGFVSRAFEAHPFKDAVNEFLFINDRLADWIVGVAVVSLTWMLAPGENIWQRIGRRWE